MNLGTLNPHILVKLLKLWLSQEGALRLDGASGAASRARRAPWSPCHEPGACRLISAVPLPERRSTAPPRPTIADGLRAFEERLRRRNVRPTGGAERGLFVAWLNVIVSQPAT